MSASDMMARPSPVSVAEVVLGKAADAGHDRETAQRAGLLDPARIIETERMLKTMLDRAAPELPEGAKTPAELAREAHDALRADNLTLIDDLRLALSEVHAQRKHILRIESDLAVAQDRWFEVAKALGAIRAHLKAAGGPILDAIKAGDAVLDEMPAGVRAFAPGPFGSGTPQGGA